MICPECSFDNPDGMRFCGRCGAALALRCESCGFDNPAGFRFCGRCGAGLVAGAAPAPQPADGSGPRTAPHAQAERRQLTVMFCDLVDSTPLSQKLDPEELRSVVQDYQRTCGDVIARFDGHVAQYLGDGLLVYFGYPYAHEDDAARAARTGLEIIRAITTLNRRLVAERGVELAVRIGIHTGLVVVGDVGLGREQLAHGDTTNLAARLQGVAEPNTVVISQATARLVAGYFDIESLGTFSLKGFLQPVSLQRVVRESGAGNRVDALDGAGLTPLVGRDAEMRRLESLWELAASGSGQAVTICGDPGIGKSRLVKVFKGRAASRDDHLMIECRCSPYGETSALKPIIEGLTTLFSLDEADGDAARLDRLEQGLAAHSALIPEHVPSLASLLGIPTGDRYPASDLSPQARRGRVLEAIVATIETMSRCRPVLFVLEDLHWVDPSTLELVDLLMQRTASHPVMLLVSCRPQFRREWPAAARLTTVHLGRLTHAQVEVMVTRVTGGKALPREVLAQILAKTDGVPLFVEELTKMVLESGLLVETENGFRLTGALPPLAIPTTLHDSLMARLDRLSTVKEVAQIGATIGREFDFELLRIVADAYEPTLRAALARLVESEIVVVAREPGETSGGTYMFRHALIQDAAYESLLKSRRQLYHQRIAQALEEHFPATIIEHPELLAMHYSSAGIERRALFYWQLAGQNAAERSAHVEAIDHLERALELVARMPESRERSEQELAVQVALGVPLMATRGIAAPEVARCYGRAYELCLELGDTPQLFAVARGLSMFYWVAGNLRRSLELGDLCIELAGRYHPEDRLVEAHRVAGPTRFWLGDFVDSERSLRSTIELYDPARHGQHAVLYGQDPKVVGLAYLGCVLWFLGYADQARESSRLAIEHGRALGHTQTLIPALVFASLLHYCLGDAPRTRELAVEIIALSSEHVLPMWLALGTMMHGWALAELGESERGAALIVDGHRQWEGTGAGLARPFVLGLIVEARAKTASTEEEIVIVDEALAIVESSGERFWQAELLRLRGALTARLGLDRAEEALATLDAAREVARQQSALAIELRVAISRRNLLFALGREDEGQQQLDEVVARFTEGFETADMRRALTPCSSPLDPSRPPLHGDRGSVVPRS